MCTLNGLWSDENLLSGDNGSSEIQFISKLKKIRVFVIPILFHLYLLHLNKIEFALLLVNRFKDLFLWFFITRILNHCTKIQKFFSK